MAPPRRVRDEALILRRPGKPDQDLTRSHETTYGEAFPSQRRFLVSPDARVLAYTTLSKQMLELVRRDGRTLQISGVENQELRFSPDGTTFAVERWHERKRRIERVDLARLTMEPWADLPNVYAVLWMEFCARGLVILHVRNDESSKRALTLLPWQGEPETLVETDFLVSRFVVAKAGTRIVYFHGNEVFSVDGEGGERKKLGDTRILVENAEMSPDGRLVVLATGDEAYAIEGDGPLVPIAGHNVHTIWFSRDGQSFVWANQEQVTWQKGAEARTLFAEEGAPIRTARYLPASPGLLVARGRDLLRWNPERSETDVLAQADEGTEMLGGDVFGGGVVLWTGTPWVRERRILDKF